MTRPRPVHLFGKDYYWLFELGQPLQLIAAAPPRDPTRPEPEGLHETVGRLFAGPLPYPYPVKEQP